MRTAHAMYMYTQILIQESLASATNNPVLTETLRLRGLICQRIKRTLFSYRYYLGAIEDQISAFLMFGFNACEIMKRSILDLSLRGFDS